MTQSVIITGKYRGVVISRDMTTIILDECYYSNFQTLMIGGTVFAVMPSHILDGAILGMVQLGSTCKIYTDIMYVRDKIYLCRVDHICIDSEVMRG